MAEQRLGRGWALASWAVAGHAVAWRLGSCMPVDGWLGCGRAVARQLHGACMPVDGWAETGQLHGAVVKVYLGRVQQCSSSCCYNRTSAESLVVKTLI